jgi:hypothetical protein
LQLFFGVNGGRVAEVATGTCDWPNVEPADAELLPPPGPYLTKFALNSVIDTLNEAITAIELAEETKEIADVKAALILAKETIQQKIDSLEEA